MVLVEFSWKFIFAVSDQFFPDEHHGERKDTGRVNIEILDKIFKVFTVIPESFFPYKIEVLEEALNIITKE